MAAMRRALLTAPLLALGAAAIARQRRQVQRALPELRMPAAYLAIPLSSPTLGVIRAAGNLVPTTVPSGVERVEIDSAAGPLAAYLYRPGEASARGALLWIHGGGRVLGSAAQDHAVCQALADGAGVVVLSVDYRLAPEHPFPAAHDDCVVALTWLREHCIATGVPDAVAVGGLSAGGGLAAEVAQWATDNGIPLVLQLLLYPMLDDRTLDHGPGDRGHLIWTPAANRFAWSAYLGHDAGGPEDRKYAVAARREDLTGLAPAWIGVGDLDLFYEEDCQYAARLEEAGVPVSLYLQPGMYHGADQLPGALATDSVRRLRAGMVAALASAVESA